MNGEFVPKYKELFCEKQILEGKYLRFYELMPPAPLFMEGNTGKEKYDYPQSVLYLNFGLKTQFISAPSNGRGKR